MALPIAPPIATTGGSPTPLFRAPRWTATHDRRPDCRRVGSGDQLIVGEAVIDYAPVLILGALRAFPMPCTMPPSILAFHANWVYSSADFLSRRRVGDPHSSEFVHTTTRGVRAELGARNEGNVTRPAHPAAPGASGSEPPAAPRPTRSTVDEAGAATSPSVTDRPGVPRTCAAASRSSRLAESHFQHVGGKLPDSLCRLSCCALHRPPRRGPKTVGGLVATVPAAHVGVLGRRPRHRR